MFLITTAPQVRGRLPRRNVEELEFPNAHEVQPQGEVTNGEICEAITMLIQVVTNQFGQQNGSRQEKIVTSKIPEFFKMNPPSFIGSSTTEVPENYVTELKKFLM